MTASTVIELELDKQLVPVVIGRVGRVPSRHTGAPLVELRGVAVTRNAAEHQRLARVLQEVGGQTVLSAEPWENGTGRWNVSWNSYAESGGEHRYTLILREEEELSLEALIVDGVSLRPYEYREKFSDDELTIWAKLVGSKAAVLRLRALLKTRTDFPVIRRGIHNEPRQMRFGVAEWSEHDGRIKARMVLVDRDADPTAHPELVRIEEANTRSALTFYMNFVENLAQLLEARGILPAEQIEAARAAAREELWQTRHEFWRVPDVDLL